MLVKYLPEELETKIGYHFLDADLLRQALTHSSYANEHRASGIEDYERLEFLGDAVLELVSSEYLYKAHQTVQEGSLTKLRASMVCEPALAFCARALEIENFLFLGKGEDNTGGRERDSILSDVLEAVIGAIYLDGGMENARAFIHRFILEGHEDRDLFLDSKSKLQEYVQGTLKQDVSYQIIGENGPEHNKTFLAAAVVGNDLLGKGEGKTKKAAEQQAAYNALLVLRDR